MSLTNISISYVYDNGISFDVSFSDGLVAYQMYQPDGTKGGANSGVPFNQSEPRSDLHHVSWHEPDVQDAVTLVLDMESKTVMASGISGYRGDTPMELWHGGKITNIDFED